ncbi:mucin-19-like [Schistocerca piceifrons]|uniref:mucin-19-like n=1 Tax=Schistocerca piceifrons TaxID=274613 RepID=UPI001F5F2BB9|nr:mucin-19-like [Schistocerca piceifrons]
MTVGGRPVRPWQSQELARASRRNSHSTPDGIYVTRVSFAAGLVVPALGSRQFPYSFLIPRHPCPAGAGAPSPVTCDAGSGRRGGRGFVAAEGGLGGRGAPRRQIRAGGDATCWTEAQTHAGRRLRSGPPRSHFWVPYELGTPTTNCSERCFIRAEGAASSLGGQDSRSRAEVAGACHRRHSQRATRLTSDCSCRPGRRFQSRTGVPLWALFGGGGGDVQTASEHTADSNCICTLGVAGHYSPPLKSFAAGRPSKPISCPGQPPVASPGPSADQPLSRRRHERPGEWGRLLPQRAPVAAEPRPAAAATRQEQIYPTATASASAAATSSISVTNAIRQMEAQPAEPTAWTRPAAAPGPCVRRVQRVNGEAVALPLAERVSVSPVSRVRSRVSALRAARCDTSPRQPQRNPTRRQRPPAAPRPAVDVSSSGHQLCSLLLVCTAVQTRTLTGLTCAIVGGVHVSQRGSRMSAEAASCRCLLRPAAAIRLGCNNTRRLLRHSAGSKNAYLLTPSTRILLLCGRSGLQGAPEDLGVRRESLATPPAGGPPNWASTSAPNKPA